MPITAVQSHFEKAKVFIAQNKVQQLEKLINANKALLNETDEQGDSLLHYAILSLGSEARAILDKLILAGAPVNAINANGQTPLHLISKIGLWKGFSLKKSDDLFSLMLRKHADPTIPDARGFTSLHHAANQNNVWAINELTARGCNADHVNENGITPLHVAALGNHLDAFKLLLQKGANLNSETYPSFNQILGIDNVHNQGITSFGLAFVFGKDDIVKEIVNSKIQSNDTGSLTALRSLNGDTLLHYFASKGDVKYINALLKMGCDPTIQDSSGYTPFHVACELGHLQVAKSLLSYFEKTKKNNNLEAKTKEGKTSWMLAVEYQHEALAQYLKSKGAKNTPFVAVAASPEEKSLSFIERQRQFSAELEQRPIYQYLNGLRMLGAALSHYTAGPISMGLQLLQQVALYGMPTLMNQSSRAYYQLKPYIHNNAHWTAEALFDAASVASSHAVSFSFKGMQALNYVTNPTRCITGYVTSLGLANLASYCTDNKDVQAAMLLIGREAGYFAVDAHNQYATAQLQGSSESVFEKDLNQGLTIWSSILGKSSGEAFVYRIHAISQLKNELYQAVGWAEHAAINTGTEALSALRTSLLGLESYNQLEAALDAGAQILSPLQGYISGSQILFRKVEEAQREISFWRDRALQEIEGWIYTHLVPDSDYQKYASAYLMQTQIALLSHKAQEAAIDKNTAKIAVQSLEATIEKMDVNDANTLNVAQNELAVARQALDLATQRHEVAQSSVAQCQATLNSLWETTPKGQQQNLLNAAHAEEFKKRLVLADAKFEHEYLAAHDGSADDLVKADEAIAKVQIEYDDAVKIAKEAEQNLLEVSTSLESESLSKNLDARQVEIEEAVKSWNTHQTTVSDKYDSFVAAELNTQDANAALQEAGIAYQLTQQKYDDNLKMLNAIDNPVEINMNRIVVDAINNNRGSKEGAADDIIKAIVATGAIDHETANLMMYNTLITAQKNDIRRAEHLTDSAKSLWRAVTTFHRDSCLVYKNVLIQELEVAKSSYDSEERKYQESKKLSEQARNDYAQLLSPEHQQEFEAKYQSGQVTSEDLNWKATHPLDDVRQIIALIGQPEIAMDALLDYYEGKPGGQLVFSVARSAANWLLEYKYLFVNPQSVADRLSERNTLIASLESSKLTYEVIAEHKKVIDAQIADDLLQNAINNEINLLGSREHPEFATNVAVRIVSVLERGLTVTTEEPLEALNVGGNLLKDSLIQSISDNNNVAACAAIYQSIHENTEATSVLIAGSWEAPPPVPAAPVVEQPKKHKNFGNKLWTGIKDFWNGLVAQGAAVNVGGGGVNIGVKDFNQFKVWDFNKKPQVVIDIPQRVLVNDPVYHPQPFKAPSSSSSASEPYLSDSLKYPWEVEKTIPTIPHQALTVPMGPQQPTPSSSSALPNKQPAVVAKPPSIKSSDPILPFGTYFPSLANSPASNNFGGSMLLRNSESQALMVEQDQTLAHPRTLTSKVAEFVVEDVLYKLIAPVNANPALAAAATAGHAAAPGAVMSAPVGSFHIPGFPREEEVECDYPGQLIDDARNSGYSTSFPAERRERWNTETLITQPIGSNSIDALVLQKVLLPAYSYFKTASDNAESVKSRIKAAQLPNEGRIRFVPGDNYKPTQPLPRGPNNGYIDKFGNEWVKGPSRTFDEPFEWDVQLSKLGKTKLGWISNEKDHLNVSLKGRITHR